MKYLSIAAAFLVFSQLEGAEGWALPFPPPTSSEEKPCQPTSRCKPCQCPKDCACPPICFEQGHPVKPECLPEGYLAPASLSMRCGKDVFVTGSFTYWEVLQEGMDLAVPGEATTLTPLGTTFMASAGQNVLVQDFAFKPGFQVGLGKSFGTDGWTIYGEYTWIRGHTHVAKPAPASPIAFLDPNRQNITPFGIWFPSSWMPTGGYSATATNFISSRWEYELDIGDLQFLRPSYVGQSFILEPLFGLRGAWIRQNLDIQAANLGSTNVPVGPRIALYSSNSWAVGPLAGLNGKWFWGSVFRWIGDCSASVLYTRYTKVSEIAASPSTALPPVNVDLVDHNALRANLNLSIGFGLGSYLNCRSAHWDVALTYDFMIFWHQNMMRYVADLTTNSGFQINGTPSDMYIQGLTAKASFEF